MLMEAFVAIMALIAAASLHPGVYFAMNSPGRADRHHGGARRHGDLPAGASSSRRTMLTQTAQGHRRDTASCRRAGGAPTLAVGMAQHPARPDPRRTRHDGVLVSLRHPVRGAVHPHHRRRRHARRPLHDPGPDRRGLVPAAAAAPSRGPATCSPPRCAWACWGYFLYQGVVDPLGGINTLWPLFGIANQMLAAIALDAGHRGRR